MKNVLLILLFVVCLIGFTQAEQLYYSSDLQRAQSDVRGPDPYEAGAKFVTGSTPPTITALGIIDLDNTNPTPVPSGDGLKEAHRVTLWLDSDNTKVTEVTVPSGTAGILIDGHRYAAIPEGELTLQANTAYVVSADVTNIQDSWLDDTDDNGVDTLDTADPYFVGTNDSTTWQPRWGTAGTCPDSSWHSGVFYGFVNITSESLAPGKAWDPDPQSGAEDVGTATGTPIALTLSWKTGMDPCDTNNFDPNINNHLLYLDTNSAKLHYGGGAWSGGL
ncbi:MAG: hypothetical protein JW837_09780, partial [Sedimentisphaerales bacterium]|nr:hypothetical protein [Sedimentisphaerales bacterium]